MQPLCPNIAWFLLFSFIAEVMSATDDFLGGEDGFLGEC